MHHKRCISVPKFLDPFTILVDMHRQFHLRQEKSLIPSVTDLTSAESGGGFPATLGGLILYSISLPPSICVCDSLFSVTTDTSSIVVFLFELFSYTEQWRWIASTLLTTPESNTAMPTSMALITVCGSYLSIALVV